MYVLEQARGPHPFECVTTLAEGLRRFCSTVSVNPPPIVGPTGKLILHDDIVTLGRVVQWKLDFRNLQDCFISIPVEEADAFIQVVKSVIRSQRRDTGPCPLLHVPLDGCLAMVRPRANRTQAVISIGPGTLKTAPASGHASQPHAC